MNPGRRVASPRSITTAPEMGAEFPLDIDSILFPETTTTGLSIIRPATASNILPARIRVFWGGPELWANREAMARENAHAICAIRRRQLLRPEQRSMRFLSLVLALFCRCA